METYFKKMEEAYIRKHYPKRSVFAAIDKSNKKNQGSNFIVLVIMLVLMAALTVFGITRTMEYQASGESDMIKIGMIISAVGFILSVLMIGLMVLTVKRSRMGAETLLKKCAKDSGLKESELREFEGQAMASDSYILKLTGKINGAIGGQKDGILTRDFVYLGDSSQIVMRCSNVISAILVDMVIYITVNKTRKTVHYLGIRLVSEQGIQATAETTKEAGMALQAMLREKNPQLDTGDGVVMSEKQHDQHIAEKLSAR